MPDADRVGFYSPANSLVMEKMKVIKTEILIKAKPEKIWAILTDFENYPDWNPFIRSISGIQEKGRQLAVKIQPPDSGPMRFKPIILHLEPGKELRWKGKLLIKGIFDGEHSFAIEDNHDGTSTFMQGEIFSGFLVRFFSKSLGKTKNGFIQMNEALKTKCESR